MRTCTLRPSLALSHVTENSVDSPLSLPLLRSLWWLVDDLRAWMKTSHLAAKTGSKVADKHARSNRLALRQSLARVAWLVEEGGEEVDPLGVEQLYRASSGMVIAMWLAHDCAVDALGILSDYDAGQESYDRLARAFVRLGNALDAFEREQGLLSTAAPARAEPSGHEQRPASSLA